MSLIVFLVFHNNYLPLVYWFWRRSCLNIVVALFYYGDIISLEELMTWTFIGKNTLNFIYFLYVCLVNITPVSLEKMSKMITVYSL